MEKMKRILLMLLLPVILTAQNIPFRGNIVPVPGFPDSIGTPSLHWHEIWADNYYGLLSGARVDTSTGAQNLANQWRLGAYQLLIPNLADTSKYEKKTDSTDAVHGYTTLYQNSNKGALAGNNTWTGTNIFNLDLSTHGAFYSGVANSTSGGVYLYDASSSYTGLLTPTGLSANRQYLLPNKGGTVILSSDTASMLSPYQHHYSILDSIGKLIASTGFLYNDGSGNLSWSAGGGGGLSAIYYDSTHYTHWGIGHGDTVLIPASRIAMLDNANTFTQTNTFPRVNTDTISNSTASKAIVIPDSLYLTLSSITNPVHIYKGLHRATLNGRRGGYIITTCTPTFIVLVS